MSRRRAPRAQRCSRRRLAVLAAVVFGMFLVAALRAAQLQLVQDDELRAQGERQRRRQLELLPERGPILDRNGRELAAIVPGTSVFADPLELLADPDALVKVCRALGIDPGGTARRLRRGGGRFAWLARGVTPDQERALLALEVEAVGIAREPHRYYPKKSLAGQVLGFVGVDGGGLGGLEHRYDSLLKGAARTVWAERDARGRLMLSQAPDRSAGQGRGLVLTLDEMVQHIAEEELAAAVRRSEARGGMVVVMEPASGEILALAQVPLFNPNSLGDSRPDDRKVVAAVDVYEPGSTVKALFLGLLMDRGAATARELVFCENGEWRIHGHTIHDHHPHGWLSVADVLKVSSNIGVSKLSDKISPQALYDGLRGFGLGEASAVELPGESRGILPPVAEWSKMTPRTAVYGQGISATGIQMVAAFAAVANGGVRMQPRLVRAVVDEAGRPVQRFAAQVAGRALSAETAAALTRLLERVVSAEEGTGAEAAVPGYRVAGKTGTSWKPDPVRGGYQRQKVVASFAGFVPSRRPDLAILVAVDEPTKGLRYGGTVAAPAFREIARRVLAYRQVAPDPEEGVSEPVAKAAPKPARPPRPEPQATPGRMPNLQGLTMRAALRAVAQSGVAVTPSLLGSGVAFSQHPAPGEALHEGQACRVEFQPLL
ncbi:MAG: penicillin-binding protein [Deferrisomatales bacterium]|nr:penicillin-binding protein [Deferrisomatales bacterium]